MTLTDIVLKEHVWYYKSEDSYPREELTWQEHEGTFTDDGKKDLLLGMTSAKHLKSSSLLYVSIQ
jgi:hypothetical protein